MLINICVCTFKRPRLLQSCLKSLERMERPEQSEGIRFAVTVIDNDSGGTAREVVNNFIDRVDISVVYQVEEKRGIPCARNRALAVTREMQAEMVVFIDDDERVRPDWLVCLLGASQRYGHRAAVHGLVMPQLSDSVSADVAGLFTPRVRTEGQLLSACATDNVMVPMAFINSHKLRFDESRPLAGGTDTIFFTQARRKGLEIYQTNRAVVEETIPESRANLKWLIRRKFRAGLTDAWRKMQKGQSRSRLVISAISHILVFMMKAFAFAAMMSGLKRNESLLGIAKYTGILMGCFNFKVDSYKVVD